MAEPRSTKPENEGSIPSCSIMTTRIDTPLPKEVYQTDHLRLRITGKPCPECGRIFQSNIFLKGHLQYVHKVPDPTRQNELKRWREKKRKGAK
jgi:hypothetical protein